MAAGAPTDDRAAGVARAVGKHASRWWPHIRVLLIFFHVACVLVFSLPDPGGIGNRHHWKSERSQIELERWAHGLSTLGIDTDKESLEATLWSITQGYLSVRRKLVKPFDRYVDAFGLRQGWRMFANPQTHPASLYIEIEEEGQWRLIFVPRSDKYDWRRRQFDHNRMRKLSGRVVRRVGTGLYDELVRWLARQAAIDFPEATRLRVRLRRWVSPKPDVRREHGTPEGRLTDQRVMDLEHLR